MFNRKRIAGLERRIAKLEHEVARLSDLSHREKLVLRPSRHKRDENLRCGVSKAGGSCPFFTKDPSGLCKKHRDSIEQVSHDLPHYRKPEGAFADANGLDSDSE